MHVVAVIMPNRHCILTESLPSDIPRRWNKLVSQLWGHKQRHTERKKNCKNESKSPPLKLHYWNNSRYYSCISMRQCQNSPGLSRPSGQLFSLHCSPPPNFQPKGSPFLAQDQEYLASLLLLLF